MMKNAVARSSSVMVKRMKIITLCFISLFVVFGGSVKFILNWVDQEKIPSSNGYPIAMRFIAAVYPLIPGHCGEACVTRTISIANLLALSGYGENQSIDFIKDLGLAHQLLNSVLESGGLPDKTAELELALERLNIDNRMTALAIKLKQSPSENLEPLQRVLKLKQYSYDQDTVWAIQREVSVYNVLHHQALADIDRALDSTFKESEVAGSYNSIIVGLAFCVIGKAAGDEYIQRGSPYFSNKQNVFTYMTSRNIDAPLIGSASAQSCKSIDKLIAY